MLNLQQQTARTCWNSRLLEMAGHDLPGAWWNHNYLDWSTVLLEAYIGLWKPVEGAYTIARGKGKSIHLPGVLKLL